MTTLPVAVIGAGSVGLAVAAHLLERGEMPVVFEAGAEVGANVRDWAHVLSLGVHSGYSLCTPAGTSRLADATSGPAYGSMK